MAGGRTRGAAATRVSGQGIAASPALVEAWTDTLQRLCARAAHSFKGSLNGVSVNLEVVRSRAERDTPAADVRSFAAAASQQLDDVIAMSEAILFLARPPREPVDLAAIVRHVGTMLCGPARTEGRWLAIESGFDLLGRTTADAATARFVVAAVLLAAVDASANVRCTPVAESAPTIRVESADHAALSVPRDVAELAAESGIHIIADPNAVLLVFPS